MLQNYDLLIECLKISMNLKVTRDFWRVRDCLKTDLKYNLYTRLLNDELDSESTNQSI